MEAVGGAVTAAIELRAASGWNSCGHSSSSNPFLCNDTYGFSALPGGYGNSDGSFNYVEYNGYWWSSTEYNSYYAYSRYMYYYYSDVDRGNSGKSYLFSVRCLQD